MIKLINKISQKIKKEFNKKLLEKIKIFNSIIMIEENIKFRLYRIHRSHQIKLLKCEMVGLIIGYIIFSPFAIVILCMLFTTPLILQIWTTVDYTNFPSFLIYFACPLSLVLANRILTIPKSICRAKDEIRMTLSLILSIIFSLYILRDIIINDFIIKSFIKHILYSVSLFFIAIYIIAIIAYFYSFLIKITSYLFNKIFHLDSVIIDELIKLIHVIESSDNLQTDLRLKKGILGRIERIAALIDRLFKRKLRSGDLITNEWTKEISSQITSSLRMKKRWIITPSGKIKNDLLKYIYDFTIRFIFGDWCDLEKIVETEDYKSKVTFSNISTVIKKVLVGILPISIAFLIQNNIYSLPINIFNYIFFSTLIWAMITLLLIFDPLLIEKISLITSMNDSLPSEIKKLFYHWLHKN